MKSTEQIIIVCVLNWKNLNISLFHRLYGIEILYIQFVYDTIELYNIRDRKVHLTEARFCTESLLYFMNVLSLSYLYNQTTGSDHFLLYKYILSVFKHQKLRS